MLVDSESSSFHWTAADRETASVSRVLEHRGSASSSLSSSLAKARGKGTKSGAGGDGYAGKFVWRIEAFTRLKDLLKKRKITGLCIKSRRFTVGGRDCRLIVYPRGVFSQGFLDLLLAADFAFA